MKVVKLFIGVPASLRAENHDPRISSIVVAVETAEHGPSKSDCISHVYQRLSARVPCG